MKDDEKELFELFHKRVKERKKYIRGRNWARQERQTASCKDVVGSLFQKDPHALKKILESQAVEAWSDIVGSAGSEVSRAIKIHDHQMIIQVEDPVWRQQFILLRGKFLAEYKKRFPTLQLRNLYFKGLSR